MDDKHLRKVIKQLQGEPNPALTMYFVFKGKDRPEVRFVDLDEKVALNLAANFRDFLVDKLVRDPLAVENLSVADERKYDALVYDLEPIEPIRQLRDLLNNPHRPQYSHRADKNLQLDGFIFILANDRTKITFYKEHYPVNLIQRDSIVFIPRDARFVETEGEIFRINNTIDFLQTPEKLYVLNLKVLETNFKIHDVLKKQAIKALADINSKGFLANPTFLEGMINDSPEFARKVLRINKNSPVLQLNFSQIRTFIEGHPHLNGKFNFQGSKIKLGTKVSGTLYIKLVHDDFLKSELTQKLYDSITKDSI